MAISVDKLPETIGRFALADEEYRQTPGVQRRIAKGFVPVVDLYGYVGFVRADLPTEVQERHLRGVFTRKFRRDFETYRRGALR